MITEGHLAPDAARIRDEVEVVANENLVVTTRVLHDGFIQRIRELAFADMGCADAAFGESPGQ